MKTDPAGGREKESLRRGSLWGRLEETTAKTLASGALQPVPTSFEFVEEGGMRFLVRILESLARKDEERWRREKEAGSGARPNPFLPYEKDLFVGRLADSHLCLLNKFNVVEHHLLIVTEEYEDQGEYLTAGDLEAMLSGLSEYPSLAFYNGGTVAGASQPHKHLQLVPLPLAPEGPEVPLQPAIDRVRYVGPAGTSSLLPFRHAVSAMDPRWLRNPAEGAAGAREVYHLMLQAVGMEREPVPRGSRQSTPYNLVATREWMLLVPRSREFFDGASVNALGFAGALLVRSESELARLRKRGPLEVLKSVAFPPPSPAM